MYYSGTRAPSHRFVASRGFYSPCNLDTRRYDTGTISGILAMPYWEALFSTGYRNNEGQLTITASQSATIVSILSAGTFFGALGAAPVADFVGRRWSLISSCLIFILGVVLQTVATAIPIFLAGRFFAGFGVGWISASSKYTHCTRSSPGRI